jgi:hypothetical protein
MSPGLVVVWVIGIVVAGIVVCAIAAHITEARIATAKARAEAREQRLNRGSGNPTL